MCSVDSVSSCLAYRSYSVNTKTYIGLSFSIYIKCRTRCAWNVGLGKADLILGIPIQSIDPDLRKQKKFLYVRFRLLDFFFAIRQIHRM